jgi:hypothetical protein
VLNKSNYLRQLAWFFIPFWNYKYSEVFEGKSDEFLIEYGIHDTFDSLAPKYDHPMRWTVMERIARGILKRPFEIVGDGAITVLRTIVRAAM